MIIGIDGNEANVDRHVGSSTYTINLLKRFQKIANKDIQFKIYLRHRPSAGMPEHNEFFQYIVIPGAFGWSRIWLPLHLYLHRTIDVFFAPAHYTPNYCPVPMVVTIHDLAYFYYPNEFLKKDLYKLQNWTQYGISHAAKIIAVSKTTKKDIIKFYSIPENNVEVIYNGYEKDVAGKTNKNILDTWDLHKQKYILYVGTLQPRKNIGELLTAFEQLASKYPDYKLVITGKKGWMYDTITDTIELLKSKDRIVLTGFVPDDELTTLYRNAFCFVLPSLYEGFGIPLLEAMSHDCPVLASHSSSLPEVGGEACIYFDPQNPQDLCDKISYLLENTSVRKELIAKGKERIKQFSWDECAQQTLNVLTHVHTDH